jgi:hypothetical protein
MLDNVSEQLAYRFEEKDTHIITQRFGLPVIHKVNHDTVPILILFCQSLHGRLKTNFVEGRRTELEC